MEAKPGILLIAGGPAEANSTVNRAIQRLVGVLEAHGYTITETSSARDGLALVQSEVSYGAVILDWDLSHGGHLEERAATSIIRSVRQRSHLIPVFLLSEESTVGDMPLDVVREVREYIRILHETPEFIARRIDFAVEQYYGEMLPPYFKALKELTEEGTYQWDAPGHMGGAAYLKHPAGREFHRFFGENIMRADIGISNVELGSWLDHVGPPAKSEDMAARVFNSTWTHYVLAGSSNSNRIVCQGAIGAEEMVVADRNCHKSLNHALTLARARPAYFVPLRNGYGMIGLIPPAQMSPEAIRDKIAASPLADGAASTDPSYMVVTNSTYDGLCYDVKRVVDMLAPSTPRLHFDEAWYAYAHFHPIYRDRYAMAIPEDQPGRPTLFAVQSTHKMLPAFSMASYIHVKPSDRAPLEYDQFHEAFMMHGTTSPFYPMIASMDVATAMMDKPSGPALMEETIRDAIAFRKATDSVSRRLRAEKDGDWFFSIYQPHEVIDPATGKRWSFCEAPEGVLARDPRCWTLKPGEAWHGFPDEMVADDYCLLDPTKVTILCPGVKPDGTPEDTGIPGPVLTAFLDARRTEIARTGDYTVLTLFSVGTTTGKWGTLLETLLAFKRLYDMGAPLAETLPDLVAAEPGRYGGMTLKELCDDMHGAMVDLRLGPLMHQACSVLPEQVMSPAAAYQQLVRYKTEKVRVSDLMGRVCALMLVPYPPGIPVVMPGERVVPANQPLIDYLIAMEDYSRRFPGFEREVQGLEIDTDGHFWTRVIVEEGHTASHDEPEMRRSQPGDMLPKAY